MYLSLPVQLKSWRINLMSSGGEEKSERREGGWRIGKVGTGGADHVGLYGHSNDLGFYSEDDMSVKD